jgi:hypothetical protein
MASSPIRTITTISRRFPPGRDPRLLQGHVPLALPSEPCRNPPAQKISSLCIKVPAMMQADREEVENPNAGTSEVTSSATVPTRQPYGRATEHLKTEASGPRQRSACPDRKHLALAPRDRARRSPGCDRCQAESLATRCGWTTWGPNGERKRTSEANWRYKRFRRSIFVSIAGADRAFGSRCSRL